MKTCDFHNFDVVVLLSFAVNTHWAVSFSISLFRPACYPIFGIIGGPCLFQGRLCHLLIIDN